MALFGGFGYLLPEPCIAACPLYGSFMRRFHRDNKAMLKWAYFNREPYMNRDSC